MRMTHMVFRHRDDILCACSSEELGHLTSIKVLRRPLVNKLVVAGITVVLLVVLGSF
jgi:hypothetical protein